MSIFQQIWEWIKNIFKAIYDYFNPPTEKKPTVRITVLAVALLFVLLPQMTSAQRTDVPAIGIFDQPNISNVDYWVINWHNGGVDSITINKNDSIRVFIRNNSDGVWYNYISLPDKQNSTLVNVILDRPFSLETELTFNISSVDSLGNVSKAIDSVKVRWMASDINKMNSASVKQGYIRGDYSVDGLDLLELSRTWGKTGVDSTYYEDITGDGNVDGLDLIEISKNWGRNWSN